MEQRFQECYELWLSKKQIEPTEENFKEFCSFHNKENDRHRSIFYDLLKMKIEEEE